MYRMQQAFLTLASSCSRAVAPRPYVRPWADDDDERCHNDSCHGDKVAVSNDVRMPSSRRPFNVISGNCLTTDAFPSAASFAVTGV